VSGTSSLSRLSCSGSSSAPAFGLGDRILDFFTGSPAPEPVKQELAFGTNVGDPEIDELMHQQVDSKVLVGQARGLLAVQTPAGLLRIWGAPTSDGGLCTYMRVGGASSGWLSCETPAHDSGPFIGSADERNEGGKTVRFVSGQARDEVASMELRLVDGSTLPVRMVGSFFFRALFPGQEPAALVGRDSSGEVVSELRAALGNLGGVLPPTYPTGPSHQVFVLATDIGQITMELAPGPDRKRCWIVTAETSQLISCHRVRGLEFDLGPYYNPEQADRIVLVRARRQTRSVASARVRRRGIGRDPDRPALLRLRASEEPLEDGTPAHARRCARIRR
jgi:hypothetical protein